MVGDRAAVTYLVEPKPVVDSLAKEKPAEILAPEAEAEAETIAQLEAEAKAKASAGAVADAKTKAEADEPQCAPLKAVGEKKTLNNLAGYGDYYSLSDE